MLSRLKGMETIFSLTPVSHLRPCDVLSRLKGMETVPKGEVDYYLLPTCDVLSRLKGMETFPAHQMALGFRPCDVLSRLKGIETWNSGLSHNSLTLLAMCFPV